jgi:hypothetical protein
VQAQEVLREMIVRYAAFTSYVDTGMVTTHLNIGSTIRTTFATLYRAPSLFRFTFFRPHPYPPLGHRMTETTIGFDGAQAYFLRREPGAGLTSKSVASLQLAIAGATGTSSGSAHTIGRLLLPVVQGPSLQDLTTPHFGPDIDLDGVECFSITAEHPRGGIRVLTIEKDRLLLRKLTDSKENRRSEEVRENISVNEPIEEQMFAVGDLD